MFVKLINLFGEEIDGFSIYIIVLVEIGEDKWFIVLYVKDKEKLLFKDLVNG